MLAVTPSSTKGEQHAHQTISARSSSSFTERFRARLSLPGRYEKIDEALAANPKLTASQLAEVKKLRAEGEVLHKAGKHQESIDTLAKAMAILKIN